MGGWIDRLAKQAADDIEQQENERFLAEIRVREKRQVRMSLLEGMRYLARHKCIKRNCGSVCLCAPCHARRALEYYDREGRWP